MIERVQLILAIIGWTLGWIVAAALFFWNWRLRATVKRLAAAVEARSSSWLRYRKALRLMAHGTDEEVNNEGWRLRYPDPADRTDRVMVVHSALRVIAEDALYRVDKTDRCSTS